MATFCYSCGTEYPLEPGGKIARRDECPQCEAAMRCCKMCDHFDSTVYNECREPLAERITEKEKANFCNYFRPGSERKPEIQNRNELINMANKLFKK